MVVVTPETSKSPSQDIASDLAVYLNNSLQEVASNSFYDDPHLLEGAQRYGEDLGTDVAETIVDVTGKLDIELKPPLDFAFDFLPKDLHAYVTDLDRKIVIGDQSLEQAILHANKGNLEYGKAMLRGLLAHELFHVYQLDKYPQRMDRETKAIQKNKIDMMLYHLSHGEQGAELFSIKYLEELEEDNPKQKKANLAVAAGLRKDHNHNLRRSRAKRFLKKMFRRS